MLKLGQDTLADPLRASLREWVLADGIGGYACSTPLGLNTRREHGLLVVATPSPGGLLVLLSRLEECLLVDGWRFELGTNAYSDALHPRGFEHAREFCLDPLPSLTFEVAGRRLTRTVARVHGAPASVVTYVYEGDAPALLELRPLVAYRQPGELQHENASIDPRAELLRGDVVLRPYAGCPPLALRVPEGRWDGDGYWYRGFHYERDREQGRDCREDLFSHGRFEVALAPGRGASLVAWAGEMPAATDAAALLAAERRRLREAAGGADGMVGALRRAADAFLVRRPDGERTILNGYPWPEDRADTALMALPGVCLVAGRREEAREILLDAVDRAVAGRLDQADAVLWLAHAIGRYHDSAREDPQVRSRLAPALDALLSSVLEGTHPTLRPGPEALLATGDPQRLEVGVQALWFNALQVAAELARECGAADRAGRCASLAAQVRASALRLFWSDQCGYLAERVSDGVAQLSVGAAQLLAVGLPHALVPREKAVSILEAVRRELLTPVGLRSLSPSHPDYLGSEAGVPADTGQRGSAWPHLAGVYFDAMVRVFGEDGKQDARAWLQGFTRHLEERGLATVGERFDGDPPHAPRGRLAFAPAVAELLRVASRLPTRPPLRMPWEAELRARDGI